MNNYMSYKGNRLIEPDNVQQGIFQNNICTHNAVRDTTDLE